MKKIKLYISGLSLFLLNSYSISAQTPGGVPLNAWYKADASSLFSDAGVIPVVDNSPVYQWNSQTGAFPLIQSNSGLRPLFSNASILANFNPTVTFDGSNDWMQFTPGVGVNIIGRENGTIYAAGFLNKLKRSGFCGFHASMDYPGLHIFQGSYKLLFFTGGPGYQGVSTEPMKAQSYFTAASGWQNGGGVSASYASATVSLNGSRIAYSGNELNNANLSDGARGFRIGADNNYGSFSGQLNEFMVFDEKLSSSQMDRVETYLAIKYGNTYANGTQNYINSSGDVMWDQSVNTGYHHNIAGIARDDAGALYQKQSWNTSLGQQVLIGRGSLSNTNASNSGTLTNGQYLIWGDNGLDKIPNVSTSAFSELAIIFQLFGRCRIQVWLV